MASNSGVQGNRSRRTLTAWDLFAILRRGLPWALAAAVAGGLIAYRVASTSTPVYSAQVGVIASQPGSQYRELSIVTPPTVDAGVYQSAILDGDVVEEALTLIDGAAPSQQRLERVIRSMRVRVEDSQRSSTIWIEVRNASPTYAADLANAVADELVVWDRERARRALDRSIDAIERAIVDIDAELESARRAGDDTLAASLTDLRERRVAELGNARATATSALVIGLLEPLRVAQPPELPIAPRVRFSTLIGVLLGLVLAYAVQILWSLLDTRPGDRDTVVAETGLPVLAEFPRRARRDAPLAAEAAGFFHTNVALATRTAGPRTIAITSATGVGEKLGVATTLAENFARSGQRTLLVDADLRHPGITAAIGSVPPTAVPFDAYLADPDRDLAPVRIAIGGQEGFDFVPSSTAERFPLDLLNAGFEACLARWKTQYDVIVLDAAPVVPFADTLVLAPACTGVVLCASAQRSVIGRVREAVALLERPDVSLLGIALTDARGGVVRRAPRAAALRSRTTAALKPRPTDRRPRRT